MKTKKTITFPPRISMKRKPLELVLSIIMGLVAMFLELYEFEGGHNTIEILSNLSFSKEWYFLQNNKNLLNKIFFLIFIAISYFNVVRFCLPDKNYNEVLKNLTHALFHNLPHRARKALNDNHWMSYQNYIEEMNLSLKNMIYELYSITVSPVVYLLTENEAIEISTGRPISNSSKNPLRELLTSKVKELAIDNDLKTYNYSFNRGKSGYNDYLMSAIGTELSSNSDETGYYSYKYENTSMKYYQRLNGYVYFGCLAIIFDNPIKEKRKNDKDLITGSPFWNTIGAVVDMYGMMLQTKLPTRKKIGK